VIAIMPPTGTGAEPQVSITVASAAFPSVTTHSAAAASGLVLEVRDAVGDMTDLHNLLGHHEAATVSGVRLSELWRGGGGPSTVGREIERRRRAPAEGGPGQPRGGGRLLLSVLLIAGALAAALVQLERTPSGRRPLPALVTAPLGAVSAWGYQLQNVSPRRIPDAVDLLVVDYSEDGSERRRYTPAGLEQLRTRPDGRRRIVLAYLSIGEAESYRWYWRRHWPVVQPAWLGPENPEWPGNHRVRFWDPEWQRLIVDPEPPLLDVVLDRFGGSWRMPYIDRILEAGFDGVYLDRVDVFANWGEARPDPMGDMVAFISRIATYARARRPGTLIFIQNGEELLERKSLLTMIDGIAKEDFLYGEAADEVPNPPESIAATTRLLGRARAAAKPVLVVEYLDDAVKRADAARRIGALGFPLVFAKRALNKPTEIATPATGTTRPAKAVPPAPQR
jgi:cysteinyl-tRNA synthetase